MIAVVILALLMVPVFFVSVQRLFSPDKAPKMEEAKQDEPTASPSVSHS
jgi:multidrug efflux pump